MTPLIHPGGELTEFHLQAGIAALHSVAPDHTATDWTRILAPYDALLRLKPSPIVALNRDVAVAQVHGQQSGLDAIAAISEREQIEAHQPRRTHAAPTPPAETCNTHNTSR